MTTPTSVSMRERLEVDYAWTRRQREVLDLLRQEKSNAEIAERLGISIQGVKWHITEILGKLNAGSREEAAEYWRRYNGFAPRFARVFRGANPSLIAGKVAAFALVGAAAVGGILIWAASTTQDDGAPASAPSSSSEATNIPDVDRPINAELPGDVEKAVRAVIDNNPDQLRSLLTETRGPCVVDGRGIFPPPNCPSGAEAGSLAPAYVFGGCPTQFIYTSSSERVAAFQADPYGDFFVGVVRLSQPGLPIVAIFGAEKLAWLGFDEKGHLIGAGGGGDCATAEFRPQTAGKEWLSGPTWYE